MENFDLQTQNDEKESQRESPNMKLFRKTQKIFIILGIEPSLIVQSYPFNRRILIDLIVVAAGTLFNFVFLFNEAKTFWEFTQSIYFGSVAIIGTFIFVHVVFSVTNIFEFIVRFENVINTSKCDLTSNRFQNIFC